MPKILEDRRKAIARNNPNLSESSTWAIATSALQKEGKLPRKKGYQEGGAVSGGDDEDPSGEVVDANSKVIGHVKKKGQASFGSTPSYGGSTGSTDTASSGVSTFNYCAGGKVISSRSV
jgi:hypothetical protein